MKYQSPIAPDQLLMEITRRICDPGSFLPRTTKFSGPVAIGPESVQEWSARAVTSMFQPIEASDGSAQSCVHAKSINEICAECDVQTVGGVRVMPRSTGVSEFRALLDSARGVTHDQLELQLLRGHLKEAVRHFEIVRAENNQLRNYLRVAGDLLGRADADPIKLAEKVEAGIILRAQERDELAKTIQELEQEADKARRVIVGNTDIENSGSLLDMLNAVLTKAATDRANLAHADEKIRELQEFIRLQGSVHSGDSAQR